MHMERDFFFSYDSFRFVLNEDSTTREPSALSKHDTPEVLLYQNKKMDSQPQVCKRPL